MKKAAVLFLTFFKIGMFTFGGGYAMIALLENEVVCRKRWITKEMFYDMTAIAESTPGPVAVNSAAFIGSLLAGPLGAVIATIAVCIPSFITIFLISLYFDRFLQWPVVGYAFDGIRAGVIYLIFSAGVQMFRGIGKTAFSVVTFIAVFVFMILCSLLSAAVSAICFVLICGAAGVAGYLIGLCVRGR